MLQPPRKMNLLHLFSSLSVQFVVHSYVGMRSRVVVLLSVSWSWSYSIYAMCRWEQIDSVTLMLVSLDGAVLATMCYVCILLLYIFLLFLRHALESRVFFRRGFFFFETWVGGRLSDGMCWVFEIRKVRLFCREELCVDGLDILSFVLFPFFFLFMVLYPVLHIVLFLSSSCVCDAGIFTDFVFVCLR